MSKEKKFYVYALLDPRKPGEYKYGQYVLEYEPFYIGKGCGNRYKRHLLEALSQNRKICFCHKCNKIRKIKKEMDRNPIIIKIKKNINEKTSLEIEKNLISLIGRGFEGPLVNMTNGGKGGLSGYVTSDETKIKRSNSLKGWRSPFYGKSLSEDHKTKIGNTQKSNWTDSNYRNKVTNSHKGKIQSKETKEKKSKSMMGEKNHRFGKHPSEETIEKIRLNNGLSIPIIAEYINFRSMSEASKYLNVSVTTIRNRLKANKDGYRYLNENGKKYEQ